jgi:hypothetical protein
MVSQSTPAANQQVPGKHQQLVISALRVLGPVLASEGYESSLVATSLHAARTAPIGSDDECMHEAEACSAGKENENVVLNRAPSTKNCMRSR